MRHRKHHGSLGLPSGHRRALMANLASALLSNGRIETTEAKARAVRPYVEKLITLGKRGDLHARRQALAKLRHRPIVDLLFSDVASAVADRNGGYTRMIKTGFRAGDAAPMAIVELVQEKVVAKKKAKPAKKAAAPKAKAEAKAEAKVEEKAEEAVAEEAVEAAAEEAVEAKAEAKAEKAAAEPAAEEAAEAADDAEKAK